MIRSRGVSEDVLLPLFVRRIQMMLRSGGPRAFDNVFCAGALRYTFVREADTFRQHYEVALIPKVVGVYQRPLEWVRVFNGDLST